jgi:cytochrome c oxidase subunit 2
MKRAGRGVFILFTCVAMLSLLLAACGAEEEDTGGDGGNAPISTAATGSGDTATPGDAEAGRAIWQSQCAMCHSLDGGEAIGPTWQGIWMHEVALEDGTTVTVDEAYITESIREPNARIVEGFSGVMPRSDLDDDEIADVIAFIQTLE